MATTAMAQVAPSPNTGKLIAAANGNPQFASTAAYIGALCPNLALGTDLRSRCAAALSAAATNPNAANMALDAITPEQILAQGGVVDGTVTWATGAVVSRLSALSHLGFGRGIASNGYQPVELATTGDTAGLGGLHAPRLQAYVNVVGGSGDRSDTLIQTGFRFDQRSITAGADYRFSDKFTAGVALSYGDAFLKFSDNGGKMDATTTMGSVYGIWAPTQHLEVTGLVGYGRIDFSSDRNIDYAESATSTIDRVAHADAHGNQWEGTFTVNYGLTAPGGWSYGPSLSVSATELDIDPFAETGAIGLDLNYNKQSTDSLQFIGGFNLSKAISTSSGVISPYGRVQAVYESLDDKRNVTVHYVDDTTGFFPGIRLVTASPDRMRYMVGGGVSAQFAGGWSGFVDAETVVGLRNVSGYDATVGVRKEF